MIRISVLSKTLLLLSLLLVPGIAGAACIVNAKATIPLDVASNAITVPVEVNGIAASFILDTGAQRSVVTGEAVQRLGLARLYGEQVLATEPGQGPAVKMGALDLAAATPDSMSS